MKILHFIYDHPKNVWVGGGGARRVAILNELLQARGHAIDVFCGRFPGCFDYAAGQTTYTFLGSSSNYLLSTFSYARAARRRARAIYRKYDLVIEDFAPWNPVFVYRLRDRPAIIQVQNYCGTHILRKYALLGLPFYIRERSYPKRFAHAVVINEALNNRLHIKGRVISMGIDEELLNHLPTEGHYVGFLGRLDYHQKGIDLLLSAMQDLKLPLKLAGDGPGRKRLARTIESLPNVEWLGWLEGSRKVEFLQRAKFLVVPSRFEGQNMAVLEAAALGKAALVSDIDELSYAVRQGFALSFRSGSVPDLRKCLQQLWQDETLRDRLQGAARDYVRNVTWPQLADRYEGFCREVILAPK